jgi:hypothetical protein
MNKQTIDRTRTREKIVNWHVSDEYYNTSVADHELNYETTDLRLLYSTLASNLFNANIAFWESYIIGHDAFAAEFATLANANARKYFFGDWKLKVPSGNSYNLPPDPEWWHQEMGFSDAHRAIEAMSTASVIGDWKLIADLAEYIATIKWDTLEYKPGKLIVDIKGRNQDETELGLELAISWLIHGREPIPQKFREMVDRSGNRREKALMALVLALETGTAVPQAFEAYFKVQCKLSAKPYVYGVSRIDLALLIEGTLLINYAKHKGYDIKVPECIGPRYIQLNV